MIKSFIAIYESGSIRQAAEELNISRANIRSSIDKLEQEFGVKLFEKSLNGMEPTSSSHKIYNSIKYLEFNIEALEKYYYINNKEVGLNISTVYITSMVTSLTKVIEKYIDSNSRYLFRYTNSKDVLKMVIEDRCSLGVMALSNKSKDTFDEICKNIEE